MSIDREKKEILRLISKISAGSLAGEPALALPAAPTRPASREVRPLTARLGRRQVDLAALKQRRQELEQRALQSGQLFELYQALEARLEVLEQLVHAGGARGSAASPEDVHLVPGSGKGSTLDPAPKPEASSDLAARSSLSGVIKEGVLADILQMLSSNVMTGVFSVIGDGLHIDLFFREGEVQHAAGEDLLGESAVFAALALEAGRFYFEETQAIPEERTVKSKTQFLILEALRQIDESRAGA